MSEKKNQDWTQGIRTHEPVLLMEWPADQLSYQANCISIPYCKQEYDLLKMSRLVVVKITRRAQHKGTDNARFLKVQESYGSSNWKGREFRLSTILNNDSVSTEKS